MWAAPDKIMRKLVNNDIYKVKWATEHTTLLQNKYIKGKTIHKKLHLQHLLLWFYHEKSDRKTGRKMGTDVCRCVCRCFADTSIVPHLEGQVGIFMHAEDLWTICDWKTLNIFLILLELICLWRTVDTLNTQARKPRIQRKYMSIWACTETNGLLHTLTNKNTAWDLKYLRRRRCSQAPGFAERRRLWGLSWGSVGPRHPSLCLHKWSHLGRGTQRPHDAIRASRFQHHFSATLKYI